MDYAEMLRAHLASRADVSVAGMEVDIQQAPGFGIMTVDADGRISDFAEKPEQPRALPEDPGHALASMGIYVFSKQLLLEVLQQDHDNPDSGHDFGRDILPAMIPQGRAHAYRFGGRGGRVTPDRYWRDVGSIDAFYDANMALLEPVPPLDLYQEDWTIRTYQGQHPPARTVPGYSGDEGVFVNSILGSGTVIAGGGVNHSILFSRVRINDEAIVEDAILFDDVVVGNNARVKHCIVDKGVVIPDGETVGVDRDKDAQRFHLSPNGIVVIPKHYRFQP
jgi:glucose-1-phosphate adenylyltransferase